MELVQHVDLPGLTAVAGSVKKAASLLSEAGADPDGHLTPDRGLAGWATGSAIAAAAPGWRTHLAGLRDQVDAFGDGLLLSAESYRAADRAAADRLRAVYGRGR